MEKTANSSAVLTNDLFHGTKIQIRRNPGSSHLLKKRQLSRYEVRLVFRSDVVFKKGYESISDLVGRGDKLEDADLDLAQQCMDLMQANGDAAVSNNAVFSFDPSTCAATSGNYTITL